MTSKSDLKTVDRQGNEASLRVAWLLPVAWFYWQPALSEYARLFPNTKVFTGLFPGFATGLEGTLAVEVVGKFQVIEINRDESSYGDNFTYLSPRIINYLWQFRPQLIFASSFGVWTILALLLKPLFWWRVIIAYEGSSPGVDYRNSTLRLFIRRIMVRIADGCITNSQAGRTYLIEILQARAERTIVQPYEIPDEHTLPDLDRVETLPPVKLQRPIFLFVGHIIPRKGLPLLLEACSILQNRGYQNYTLQVVGDGDHQPELAAFCQERQLIDRVQWVGRVAFDRIGSYFQAADVFVFPTQEDTWGVVTLEAMLLGKPILCSTGAGSSELVVPGENGYVFPPDDPVKLADLMQQFLDRPELIPKMGDRSRQLMEQYTPQAAAQRLAELTAVVMNG
jgi:glycosyltransferase involved in cell wall biosynthesis